MEDSTNQTLEIFKDTCRTVISELPPIHPATGTSTHGCTNLQMPTLRAMTSRVQLVFDVNLPNSLLQGLDRYVEGLTEDQLQATAVQEANRDKWHPLETIQRYEIYNEACAQLSEHRSTPEAALEVHNIRMNHAFYMNEEVITIFEHKTPWVADELFLAIVALCEGGHTLDLDKHYEGAHSILTKVIKIAA
ncbi:hypothetical protein FRC04_003422 [Tulasnella sp. 424]|nr:hypothetical protein FRC04_003422 [Tulasnella sp. 424]KAG8977231.1 hypothetical protein FRC05_002231 [Tulasnella sp. 425]